LAYLLIIIIVALLGIARLTLQQRREHKLHVQNDYRSSLEKVAKQPLAGADDGPRRRFELAGWTDRRKSRQEPDVRRESRKRDAVRSETKSRERPTRPKHERAGDRARERSRERARERRVRYEQRRQRRSRSAARSHGPRRAERGRSFFPEEQYDIVEWNDDLRGASKKVRIDHDVSPRRIPVSSRRVGQPSSRGNLQPEFHAAIHPAHLPPPQPDVHIDLTTGDLETRRRAG
jgi:hypothetical protein